MAWVLVCHAEHHTIVGLQSRGEHGVLLTVPVMNIGEAGVRCRRVCTRPLSKSGSTSVDSTRPTAHGERRHYRELRRYRRLSGLRLCALVHSILRV